MSTIQFVMRPVAIARTLGHEILFGLPIWALFLLALEAGNVGRALNAGRTLVWEEEVLRIAVASLLGASSTPLVLALIRSFPVERRRLWRNLAIQAVGSAAIAIALIVVSCVLAATFKVGDARPVLVALPDQITGNWLLLIFCLAALSAVAHAVRFARAEAPQTAAPPATFVSIVPIKSRGRVTLVELDSVEWIESQGNYLALHAGGAVHLLRESSQRFEAKLDPQRFVRIHRRTLVALDRVGDVTTLANGDACVRLKDGTELRVSRTFRDALRSALEITRRR